MKLIWLGTAGFRIDTPQGALLIDPYLSRNVQARPLFMPGPEVIAPAGDILVSHGHFDHLMDIPKVVADTGARVHCDPVAADSLIRDGLEPDSLNPVTADGQSLDLGWAKATAYHSRHVDFDPWLVLTTLARINFRLPRYLPLTQNYPHGQVLSWRLDIDGRVIHHFGSAGSTPDELDRLAGLGRPDVLLIPLQGNTRICDIALNYVRTLRPKLVIPHHYDDFYPPISRTVDIKPFLKGVADTPGTKCRVLEMGRVEEI